MDIASWIDSLQDFVNEMASDMQCDITCTFHQLDGNGFVTIHSEGLTKKALYAKLQHTLQDNLQQAQLPF
jgi:hypothetical protein